MKLEIRITGDSKEDLIESLEEVKRLVKIGNLEGYDQNISGGFYFDIDGNYEHTNYEE